MNLKLQILNVNYSVCQLEPDALIPEWAIRAMAVIRTDDELTIVVESEQVHLEVKAQRDFACFRVIGELAFDVIGVIAAISGKLAESKIPILSISTYNTDYFLVSSSKMALARQSLEALGCTFE